MIISRDIFLIKNLDGNFELYGISKFQEKVVVQYKQGKDAILKCNQIQYQEVYSFATGKINDDVVKVGIKNNEIVFIKDNGSVEKVGKPLIGFKLNNSKKISKEEIVKIINAINGKGFAEIDKYDGDLVICGNIEKIKLPLGWEVDINNQTINSYELDKETENLYINYPEMLKFPQARYEYTSKNVKLYKRQYCRENGKESESILQLIQRHYDKNRKEGPNKDESDLDTF